MKRHVLWLLASATATLLMAQSQPSGWQEYQERNVSRSAKEAYAQAFELTKKQEQQIKALSKALSAAQARADTLERENQQLRKFILMLGKNPDDALEKKPRNP